MIHFKDRHDAGKKLCTLLSKYKGNDVVVYALPRGGIILAWEIAKFLEAPIDLLFAHKLGHPLQPEYAVAAISESGHIVGNECELQTLDKRWLEKEKEKELAEIKRRRTQYLKGRPENIVKNKIAIIVDDGIATGLTMQAGILELRDKQPKKIIVAVPIAPLSAVKTMEPLVDEFITIQKDENFVGSVGAYYQRFNQVEDDEVIAIINSIN